jgi:hypothetical protein
MNEILNSFSTREAALIIWILIALIFCLLKKSIRESLFGILKALMANKILISILLFFTHTSFYVFILLKLGLWDKSLLKDTIFWTIGFGFVALMNVNKVNNKTYFKQLFFDAIKWTIVIEFIVNFFTFSLITELILLPVIVLSATMQAVASFEEKHKQVEILLKKFLLYLSLSIFFFSLYKTITNYSDLFTFDNFKSFILPVILSMTFLPFMYLYSLYVKYETLWVTLKFIIRNDKDRKRVKRYILWVANLNINKLVSISQNIAKPINIYNDLSLDMIRKVSNNKYIGFDE